MSQSSTKSSESSRPKRFFRFSLLSMLVVITIIALGILIVVERRKVDDLAANNQSLSKQLETHVGRLDEVDASLFSAVRVPNTVENKNQWKWRVHIPKGRRCELRFSSFEVPTDGIAQGEFVSSPKRSIGVVIPDEGEVVIEFAIFPKDQAVWEYTCSVESQTLFSGAMNFQPNLKRDTSLSVNTKPKTWNPGEHPVLLIEKYTGPEVKKLGRTRPESSHGFAVWIRDVDALPKELNDNSVK